MLKIQCKHCATMIEVPIPEPKEVQKIVKEPCKCGLTESARQSRHIATAVVLIAICILIGASAGCWTVNSKDVEKVRAETDKIKAQTLSNQKEMDGMSAELQKYKTFFEEWKKLPGGPPPQLPEKK